MDSSGGVGVQDGANEQKERRTRHSRKKQKREEARRVNEFCYEFAKSGQCPFGEERCRFNHDYDSFFGTNKEFFAAQKRSRERRLVDDSSQATRFSLPPPPFHRSYETAPEMETSLVIHAHNNCVMALCLSPRHPFFTSGKPLVQVIFGSKNNLHVGDVIATLINEDQERFNVRSPLPGAIIEFNDQLKVSTANLLAISLSTGYLVLFKPTAPYQLLLSQFFSLLATSASESGDDQAD